MVNIERESLLRETFIPIWEELLSEFLELGFEENDLTFKISVQNEKTDIFFSKKLFKELFETFFHSKNYIKIGHTQKKLYIFSNNTQISIKERPGFAFSMIQILISLSRDRLKEEKITKISSNKLVINSIISEVFKKCGITEREIENHIKTSIWYKKGIYFLKIICENKKNKELVQKIYSTYDYFLEEFIEKGIKIEISYHMK